MPIIEVEVTVTVKEKSNEEYAIFNISFILENIVKSDLMHQYALFISFMPIIDKFNCSAVGHFFIFLYYTKI